MPGILNLWESLLKHCSGSQWVTPRDTDKKSVIRGASVLGVTMTRHVIIDAPVGAGNKHKSLFMQ